MLRESKKYMKLYLLFLDEFLHTHRFISKSKERILRNSESDSLQKSQYCISKCHQAIEIQINFPQNCTEML